MKNFLLLFFMSGMILNTYAQKSDPTKEEVFEYLRGRMLTLSPRDGVNNYDEVTFNENSSELNVFFDKRYAIVYLANLDANKISWDIFNPNNNGEDKYNKLLRMTISSKNGATAKKYVNDNKTGKKTDNVARFVFDITKVTDIPEFQNKMTRTMRKMIELCEGQKAKPNKQETFDFLRSKLLALSTHDGNNGYDEVKFDENMCEIELTYETRSYDIIPLSNLDANGIAWDVFTSNSSPDYRYNRLLRVTISSKSGYSARQCFKENSTVDRNRVNSVARFYFDASKVADVRDFQNKITKALKRMIELCGGKTEKELYW